MYQNFKINKIDLDWAFEACFDTYNLHTSEA